MLASATTLTTDLFTETITISDFGYRGNNAGKSQLFFSLSTTASGDDSNAVVRCTVAGYDVPGTGYPCDDADFTFDVLTPTGSELRLHHDIDDTMLLGDFVIRMNGPLPTILDQVGNSTGVLTPADSDKESGGKEDSVMRAAFDLLQMADGLSIAASVAGLVSLGFQVCSGITTYLDGLKCRAEELESARKYEQSLRASIQAIGDISPDLIVHHQKSSAAVATCIRPCNDELKALECLVAGLCDDKTGHLSLLDKAKASKKRLTYAFDRPKLSHLQTKKGQYIHIESREESISHGRTLRAIASTSKNTAAEIVATRADVTALADDVSTLRNDAPFIRAAMDNIRPSLLDLGQTVKQSVQGIQVVREDTNRTGHILVTEMQLMRDQLAALQSQSTINQRATKTLLHLAQQDQASTKATEQKWGLRQVGLGWLAQKAIEITFSCKSGAGGASFGPNFTYYPTVDQRTAPAFQIVKVMHDRMDYLIDQKPTNLSSWQSFLDRGLQDLEMLFQEGRASPNDMNSYNQTLIFPLMSLIWDLLVSEDEVDDPDQNRNITLAFLQGIIRLGIPSNIYDIDGSSPIDVLTRTFHISSAEAVDIFFGQADEVPAMAVSQENSFRPYGTYDIPLASVDIQRESQIIAEGSDIIALNLESGCVLDAQTAVVLELLEAKRVQVPHALRLLPQQTLVKANEYPGVSVYYCLRSVLDADRFWAHGFRDIDRFNGHFDEERGDGLPPIATANNGKIIMWLFNHGADLFRELNPTNDCADREALCVRAAHFVYRHLGYWLRFRDISTYPYFSSPLDTTVLPVGLYDNCECSCSNQGCTPFLMMVKAMDGTETRRSSIMPFIDTFLGYIEWSSYGFTRNDFKAAVRYFTFTALEMSHTCFHKPGDYTFTCSVTVEMCEDAMHIRDEQAGTIELLEVILFDLDADLDAMMEDGDHFDIRVFLTDHWLVRVEKEIERISGHELSEDFKQETEAFGVVWSETARETDSNSQDDRRDTLQYWLDAIDRAAQS
ncbi:hypothetical protein G7054_g11866 [Neopestalotiopsis clavispora]|nr:hypothetical protein G7054_g11866 [Neopestalotiopsis clavispora]